MRTCRTSIFDFDNIRQITNNKVRKILKGEIHD